jgi:RHS repeat-associated protein
MKKLYFVLSLTFLILIIVRGQNPQNINISNQPNYSSNTYVRASNSIKLQAGFKYSAASGQPLLNLSIGTYPSFVSSFYNQGYYNGPSGAVGCENEEPRTNKIFGETPGTFSVGTTGAATYSIPIYTSPGTAGMQPNISITYNSQGGYGLLGKGTDLNGLSSISRTVKTIFQDGVAKGIELNNSDVYALNGNRLYTLTGSYGADGSTYYTENETFSTIIAHGQQGQGPQWIEVKDKDGNTLEFGNNSNSRLTGIGDITVLSWQLNRITDEFGNYMTYTYKILSGERVIDKIEYTGNINAGLTPYNSVVFDYVDIGEKNTYYFGGSEFKNTKLLKSITVFAEGSQVKKYIFDYSWEKVTCLNRVIEVDANGNELYPTQFCWGDINMYNPLSVREEMKIFSNASDYTGLKSAIPADLNGDGFSDFVCVYPNSSKYKVMKNSIIENVGANANYVDFTSIYDNAAFSGKGTFLGASVTDENLDNKQEIYSFVCNQSTNYTLQKISTNASGNITVQDIGNFTDLAGGYDERLDQYYYGISDFTGDGIDDQLRIDPGYLNLTSSQGNANYGIGGSPAIGKPFEFNGDEQPEIVVLHHANNQDDDGWGTILQSNGKVEVEVLRYDNSIQNFNQLDITSIEFGIIPDYLAGSPFLMKHIAFGDFNGDGKQDLAYLNYAKNQLFIRYNSGMTNTIFTYYSAFSDPKPINNFPQLPTTNPIYDPVTGALYSNDPIYYSLTAQDLNNDGKCDIVITGDQQNTLLPINNYFSFLSIGDNFIPAGTAQGSWNIYNKDGRWVADYNNKADFNGDGKQDIVSINSPNDDYIAISEASSSSVAVSSIRSALYKEYIIKYMNIGTEVLWRTGNTRDQIFTKNSSITYSLPLVNYKPSISCVYATITNDGKSAEMRTTMRYRYYDAIFHKNGRGFLGFEKMSSIVEPVDPFASTGNPQNIAQTSVFTFETTKFVPLLSETKTELLAYAYDAITHTSDYINLGTSFSKSVFTYSITPINTKSYIVSLSRKVEKNYNESTQVSTDFTYDYAAHGNLKSTNSIYGWNGLGQVKSEASVFNYLLNNGKYKLQNTTVSATQTGQATYSRTTEFSYDAIVHLTGIINDPTFGDQSLITSFSDFDLFGHPKQKSISSGDMGTRVTHSTYDSKGRFVIKSSNAIGDFVEYIYDAKFGNILQHKDISGLTNMFEYDGLGRKIKIITPDGIETSIYYEWDNLQNYPYTNAQLGMYSVKKVTNGLSYQKEYFGGAGSLLQTETQGLNGELIVTNYKYNSQITGVNSPALINLPNSILLEKSEPHFSNQQNYLVTTYSYLPSSGMYRASSETILQRNGSTYTNQNLVKQYTYNVKSTDVTYVKGFTQIKDNNNRIIKKETNVAGQSDKIINQKLPENTTQTSVYQFNSNGKPSSITLTNNLTPQSIVTTFVYNNLGQQTQISDPSAGNKTFSYNTIGELLTQSDPVSNVAFTYDELGRVETKTGNSSGTTIYQYVTDPNGRGQVEKIISPSNITEFKYNSLHQVTEIKETIGSQVLKTNYVFDYMGRVKENIYPGGFKTKNTYNSYGYLTQIKTEDNTVLWQLNEQDAVGQIKNYEYGNGIVTQVSYTNLHHLNEIIFGSLHKQKYDFNSQTGNLRSREFTNFVSNNKLFEEFTYDNINRLEKIEQKDATTQSSIQTNNLDFDIHGNITHKDDAGDYLYNMPSHPYSLTNLTNATNNVSINTITSTYNDLKKVHQLLEAISNKQINFTYGNDEERIKVDYSISGQLQYSRYYAQNYDKQITPTSIKEWNYIFAPSGLVAIYYINNGVGQMLYSFTDHLGSPVMITDVNQNVVEEYSFDAWGRRRNPTDWSYSGVTLPQYLNRGYTFHEHIDEFGLINMNGRIYDPVLGRFIQPDNYIQDPNNLQNFNRYAYALNNPTVLIDPSGNFAVFAVAVIAFVAVGTLAHLAGAPSSQTFALASTAALLVATSGLNGLITASGIPFANTIALMAGSSMFSAGQFIITNNSSNLNISFGVGSFNFTNSTFNHLGKRGNSKLENLGYTLGALANIQDLFAGIDGKSVDVLARRDFAGHSEIRSREEDVLVSVGPRNAGFVNDAKDGATGGLKWEAQFLHKSVPAENVDYISLYPRASEPFQRTLYNVNTNILKRMTNNLNWNCNLTGTGGFKYGLLRGCVNYTSRALFMSGVFNVNALLPITSPVFLNFELAVRQLGLYAQPLLINGY